jgi:hypothetical protein
LDADAIGIAFVATMLPSPVDPDASAPAALPTSQ